MPLIGRSYKTRTEFNLFASKLNKRCTIQQLSKQVNEPEYGTTYSPAPITESYTDIKTVWCQVLPQQSLTDFVAAIRGEQQFSRVTHEIWMRLESVRSLNVEYSVAFDNDFDTIRDINNLKSDYYILLHSGEYCGRRFGIVETRLDEVNREFVKLRCSEIEEVGTGYGNG